MNIEPVSAIRPIDPYTPFLSQDYLFEEVMTLEEAKNKIKNLEEDFPDFKKWEVAYNRYGLAVVGWDSKNQVWTLLFAAPAEEKVHPVDCKKIDHISCSLAEPYVLCAKSKDKNINFHYDGCCYLNGEPAWSLFSAYANMRKKREELTYR